MIYLLICDRLSSVLVENYNFGGQLFEEKLLPKRNSVSQWEIVQFGKKKWISCAIKGKISTKIH